MSKHHVIIIGGDIGGLCSGLRLLHAGYEVSIYEKCGIVKLAILTMTALLL